MTFLKLTGRVLAPVAMVAALGAAPATAQSGDVLTQVQGALAATQSLTANFVQTDGKNRSLRGALSMKRPGKIRFEYGGGANMLLVADGRNLTFVDYDVGQKSAWPIAKSPLAVLLGTAPDLKRIARPLPSPDPRVVLVRARDARRPEFGTLILAFVRSPSAPGGLLLEGWTAFDAQNKKTTVKLENQRYNVAVPETAFTYAEPKRRR
jgi:outer membrane lipoprotein-sorting protein